MLKKFQHFVIKDIQDLKISTRSDMCESMRGMLSITCEIDKRKLLFSGKVCKLDCNYLTKAIFLTRLYDFIQNNGKQFTGTYKGLIQNFETIQPASSLATSY